LTAANDREDFARSPHTRARGNSAEESAAAWLADHGYVVVERNVRTAAGEIDVVAREGDTLCFIEVKARAGIQYGLAIEAVDRRKQRRIARSASLYLAFKPYPGPCRFDVLGLDPAPNGWEYTLIRNAFEL
jgi:putative endonuclease